MSESAANNQILLFLLPTILSISKVKTPIFGLDIKLFVFLFNQVFSSIPAPPASIVWGSDNHTFSLAHYFKLVEHLEC